MTEQFIIENKADKKEPIIVKYPHDLNRWPDKSFNNEFYSMACAITDLKLWHLLQEKDAKNYNQVQSNNFHVVNAIMSHKLVKKCGHSLFSSSYAYQGMVELANLGFIKFCRLIKNKYYRNNRRNPKRLCRKL